MKPELIDEIRDLALKIERHDIETSHILMKLAYKNRPDGPFIKKKHFEYRNKIQKLPNKEFSLKELVQSGDLVIIPIGFRCHTRGMIREVLDIKQASLPFDNGFFSPSSVISILKNPKIALDFNKKSSYKICKKFEAFEHNKHGRGIKFEVSSKEEIDLAVTNKDIKSINSFLDTTFGYYTLDTQHNYVLAHYNWSSLADVKHSKGCKDMELNLKNTSSLLNRRINRMMENCHSAKVIIFLYHNPSWNKFMLVGEKMEFLDDLSELQKTANNIFKSKVHVLSSSELNIEKLYEIISSK